MDPQTQSKTSLPKASTLGQYADMPSSPLCLCGNNLSAHLSGWFEWNTNPTIKQEKTQDTQINTTTNSSLLLSTYCQSFSIYTLRQLVVNGVQFDLKCFTFILSSKVSISQNSASLWGTLQCQNSTSTPALYGCLTGVYGFLQRLPT